MARIKWALLGGGPHSLIGSVHRIAALMGDDYQLIGGVFSSDPAAGCQFARDLELDPARAYPHVDAFIAGETGRTETERAIVATIATPNYLHFEMASKLIDAGFHVICEKPVTVTAAEAAHLKGLLNSGKLIFAVAHTYTGYPMVRQMRAMIEQGALGTIHKVDTQYYQGWIQSVIHDSVKRSAVWRLDPNKGGLSCCIGDIGVHAFDLLEYVTQQSVVEVLADLTSAYPGNPLDVDASVLLRLRSGAKGIIRASQIATAEENNLRIAIYGETGGLKWAQENPNVLEYLQEGKPLTIFKPGHDYNLPPAREATMLPPGHPEGLIEAMGNIYRGVAQAIRGRSTVAGAFPGIDSGVRAMNFLEAVLASARLNSTWVTVPP